MYLQWDLLTKVGQVQPIVHIANGRDPSSRISLLCLHVSVIICYLHQLYLCFFYFELTYIT